MASKSPSTLFASWWQPVSILWDYRRVQFHDTSNNSVDAAVSSSQVQRKKYTVHCDNVTPVPYNNVSAHNTDRYFLCCFKHRECDYNHSNSNLRSQTLSFKPSYHLGIAKHRRKWQGRSPCDANAKPSLTVISRMFIAQVCCWCHYRAAKSPTQHVTS